MEIEHVKNYNFADIYKFVDLTLLDKAATNEQILETFSNAQNNNVAAICLYADAFGIIPNTTKLKKATVVNFPSGEIETKQVIDEINQAVNTYQVDEIDYVFPYQTYLANEQNKALDSYCAIIETCQEYNKTLKVIIESGAFVSSDSVYELSSKLANLGCDFIKTSTGKIPNGASLEAAFAILNAIKDTNNNCGIKISGGIRTFQQAKTYIQLAENVLAKAATPEWFRIGTSKLK